ncbi:MAG: rRNA maturation RNase YbeY [Chloroflexi bacterium]|nr:rRNA maturation RNase YbeY [Chloroflexota bacterium]
MEPDQMDIRVQVDEQFRDLLDEGHLASLIRRVLTSEGKSGPLEVGLFVTDQETIRDLNREYRHLDEPTDVLSFALNEPAIGKTPFVLPPDAVVRLGEVVISYPQACIQARTRHKPVDLEIALLLVHGVLHLLGYDHERPDDEVRMRAREKAILETSTP